jgi:hypothetical protein
MLTFILAFFIASGLLSLFVYAALVAGSQADDAAGRP